LIEKDNPDFLKYFIFNYVNEIQTNYKLSPCRKQLRISLTVLVITLSCNALDTGIDEYDQQRISLTIRITGEMLAPGALLSRLGRSCIKARGKDPQLHHLLA